MSTITPRVEFSMPNNDRIGLLQCTLRCRGIKSPKLADDNERLTVNLSGGLSKLQISEVQLTSYAAF